MPRARPARPAAAVGISLVGSHPAKLEAVRR
jgi:hypothetical protein